MKNILVLGAGRSSSSLINYLLNHAQKENWFIHVGDMDRLLAQEKIQTHEKAVAFQLDATNPENIHTILENKDLVISMLPSRLHFPVVKACLQHAINVITPSYVTDEINALNNEAKKTGILIMNELGVDPGIDHMSAKKVLDDIASQGGIMKGFESFTGGLVAPESDNNPWNYKFTWNPRNVVLAGQGGAAKFIQEGRYKYIPYTKLFRRTEIIEMDNWGKFEGYANRDSLKYRSLYNLDGIPTIFRGTLRKVGFCRAWNVFVQLGATDDTYTIEDSENMTYREFINSFLAYRAHDSVEIKLRHYLKIDQDDYIWDKLIWLGIFSDTKIGLKNATPAQVLQKILMDKWTLSEKDKDMIVMWHKFTYLLDNQYKEINSSMVYIGKDDVYTAMSDTVGLPMAICAKLILNNTIQLTGVHLPTITEIYTPVLKELERHGIVFAEKRVK